MAQHDFVPAWLSFSTPQSTKSSAGVVEKHGEHLPRGEGRLGVSRRRHNSSDGFFNNGPLRTTGDSWHQPSLLRHDSVDSGVSKGTSQSQAGWHGSSRGQQDGVGQRGGNGGSGTSGPGHRHRNGSALSRKNAALQDKQPAEAREEKNAERRKLQFQEEDFPSLNPETGKQVIQGKPAATGVWENPPSAKQPSKMLVIKKISKEDPSAFSAAFASPVPHLSNGNNKTSPSGPIVYKNLVPKPAISSNKSGPWKSNGRESKSGSLFFNRDSAFTSPVLAPAPVLSSPKEGPASVTPPLELSISRLTRMTRRIPDKKSNFLKALKDEQDADQSEDRDGDKLEDVQNQSPSDLNDADGGELGEDRPAHNGLSGSQEERRERLSYSLEAEHRLLKEMGWQEAPENDEDCLPLTEEELQEFQMKTQGLRRNGMGQNGFLRQPRRCALLFAWRCPLTPDPSECSDTDTSSTDTSDDES